MEKLQSKYECISSKSNGTDDGGEPKSQAYYVIKAAQAREAGKRDDEWSRGEIRSSWLQRNALSLFACEMICFFPHKIIIMNFVFSDYDIWFLGDFSPTGISGYITIPQSVPDRSARSSSARGTRWMPRSARRRRR